MRLIAVWVSLIALPLLAEEPRKPVTTYPERMSEMLRMRRILDRANELRPGRRDTPLRELNISDNEVREIQDIAGKFAMNTMLNISPVVTGCPCEEGPLCTDQVYVVATLPERTVGLQLSRVRNAWVVGAVQKWWLQYAGLQKRRLEDFKTWEAFEEAQYQMLLEFPVCAMKDNKDAGATTAQSRDTTK